MSSKTISTVNVTEPWWNAGVMARFGMLEYSQSWVENGLIAVALAGGPPCLHCRLAGCPAESTESFYKAIEAFGGRIVSTRQKWQDLLDGAAINMVWPHGGVEIELGENDVAIDIYSNDPVFFKKIIDVATANISKTPPAGRVHVVVSTEAGLEFESIGVGGHTIERGNYMPDTLIAFDKIIEDLKNPNPSGRLSVFNSSPGLGKTYLVRGILQAADNCVCVVVPSNLVPELSSPSVIPSLIRLRRNKGDSTPIVIIIEDADECLVSREDGNMSSISGVLNLCDGILGTLLDIRVIATTNAARMQLDKALVRPGRLSANVELQLLPFWKAEEICQRLGGPKAFLPENRSYSLAEIYSLNKDGSAKAVGMVEEKPRNRVGF